MKKSDHTMQGYLERCTTEEIKQILKEGKTKFDSAVLYTAKNVLLKRKNQKIRRIKVKISPKTKK